MGDTKKDELVVISEPLVLVFVAYKDLQCLAEGRTSVEFATVGLVDFLQEFVQTRSVGLVSTDSKCLDN